MKKLILGSMLSLGILVSPAFVPHANATTPTAAQVSIIIQLLQAFGIDQSTIATVQTSLGGGTFSTGGATLTVNGQTSTTNVDPMLTRTWAWSGTPGATYTASGVISGCDTASQNGIVSNWTPWTGGSGTASSGSSAAIPGATKYGCTITGTYRVTNTSGQIGTATASIAFKHANVAVLPPPAVIVPTNLSGLQITSENLPAGDIPVPAPNITGATFPGSGLAYSTTLTYTGGTGTPVWSLVEEDGKFPTFLTLNKDTGVISGSLYDLSWALSGMYYFTVKLTMGSDVVTKRLSILMNSYVVASANHIKILTTTLPEAVVGKPYYATIAINPEVGVSDNTWVASGVSYTNFQNIPGFPEGLVIDGKTGVISGIPVRVGITSFIVTVTHKSGQSDGSGNSMYYTIPVASSPDVTKLVSQKIVLKGNDIGVVNLGVVADIYRMVTTANFSDGSLVGQKFIWRQVGEMRNRVQGFQLGYCLKKYSPWSDEGTVPGITVRDLASKSFPATKVHTYGIEYQINPAGLYEFVAVATSADGSTFKAAPHLFKFNKPGDSEGDLSQADWLKLPAEQQNIPDTCDVSAYEQASSNVAVQTFEEEVQNGWGQDGVVISTSPVVPVSPTSPTAPTALITINGQPSVTNADPLVQRTWGWSSTRGATYSASGNITGCDIASQNGPQLNWKPWIGGTGSAASGSTSATPGAVKYGCTIVGTYNVTNAAGETTTASATVTFKHANGSANPLPVDTGSKTPVCTGTHPAAGNGVVLHDYTPVTVSPSGPANTVWQYGEGSCGWSCTAPMLQDGNTGCKTPAPGSGTTITLNNLSTGGTFRGIALAPQTIIGLSGLAATGLGGTNDIFTTNSNGTTPEFWLSSASSGWTVVVVPLPGYKIINATGCIPTVGIQAGQTLNRCIGMQNGTPVVINLEPG